MRKSEDGKTDRLPLGGPAVRVVGPASECRGGGVAARPAKVSPQKDQEKRVFCASSEVASLSESDTASLSADSSGAFAAWDKSFVFQVSDREPALRVTYPPPFNVVAALAASPASENAGRSVWWPLAVLIRTFYDPNFASLPAVVKMVREFQTKAGVAQEKQLPLPGEVGTKSDPAR